MASNKNNFLRFTGTFTPNPYTITPAVNVFELFANEDFTRIHPLDGCSASNGINTYSFKIVAILDEVTLLPIELSSQCYWDGVSNLTVYRPVDLSIEFILIEFTFEDYLGNIVSTPANSKIEVSTISTAWIAYPLSQVCTLDSFGNNTGFSSWAQLILVNSITLTPITPLTLKPNSPSDADYIAPVTDIVTCPTVGSLGYGYLFLSNFTANGADSSGFPNRNTITITNLYLYSATFGIGSTPLTINTNCNILIGSSQRFYVPAGTWDSIAITYVVNAGANMDTCVPSRFWKANLNGVVSGFGPSGSGLSDNLVDNTGILAQPAGVTIPANSTGITIFAQ